MVDDLGLGLEPQDEAPARRPKRRRRRIGVVLVALATVAIVVGVGFGVATIARHIFGAPADWSGPGTGGVLVQVHPGDTATDIAHTLYGAGVVRSEGAFQDAADADARSRSIGPGYYRLHKHMQASLALALLLDPKSLVQSRIVIPEGFSLRQILARIAANSSISAEDLQHAAAHPETLGVPAWAHGHLEGFLFPATYDFAPGTTATAALSAMVTRFNQEAAAVNLVAGARRLGYTPYQVLTLSSIVQREGRLDADFPKIAEVFYNRLHRGMRLDSDATLFYVLPPDHGPLTAADLALDSPYNTRKHTGLPPTPINSPGTAALTAVLHPATGPYLYFVTIDQAGHTAFATTLAEFDKLVAQSRANGVR